MSSFFPRQAADPLRDSPLGRSSPLPRHYDPKLLVRVPRRWSRQSWHRARSVLPFFGHDEWTLWELAWRDAHGTPKVACATLWVPADSPYLCESKSLKLYLHSLNDERFVRADDFVARVQMDLQRVVGAAVRLQLHARQPTWAPPRLACLETSVRPAATGGRPPRVRHGTPTVQASWVTHVFRSLCPVTGQPDWASVAVRYQGAVIPPGELLAYLLRFAEHGKLHEQCVELIFVELLAACQPRKLSVDARFTRRGGIDINPFRSNAWRRPQQVRLWRQ